MLPRVMPLRLVTAEFITAGRIGGRISVLTAPFGAADLQPILWVHRAGDARNSCFAGESRFGVREWLRIFTDYRKAACIACQTLQVRARRLRAAFEIEIRWRALALKSRVTPGDITRRDVAHWHFAKHRRCTGHVTDWGMNGRDVKLTQADHDPQRHSQSKNAAA